MKLVIASERGKFLVGVNPVDNGVSVASFVVSWPVMDVEMFLVLGWAVPLNRINFWELLVVVGVDDDVVWESFLECLEHVGVDNGNFRVINRWFELKFDGHFTWGMFVWMVRAMGGVS